MSVVSKKMDAIVSHVRTAFRPREIFIREGSELKRVHISTRLQISAASLGGIATLGVGLACAQAASTAMFASHTIAGFGSSYMHVAQMEARVSALQSEVDKIREGAKLHAAKLDQRDALLAAILTGKADASKLAALEPLTVPQANDKLASDVRAPLTAAEQKQGALANQARVAFDSRIQRTEAIIGHLGLNSGRFQLVHGAMGGPYEPIDEKATATADKNFHALFQSWKKLDQLQQNLVAIPAIRPVDSMNFTSNFGIRVDPFNGRRAMHPGVDIPGAYGTNIYATADGIVNRAGWVNGYGNLVELDHGRGIMTRYGHLSSFVVAPGQHIHRGELIAHMGSTGRSTGTHLHYEVRIDGTAVNPVPFLQSTDYLMAMQQHPTDAKAAQYAQGGPETAE